MKPSHSFAKTFYFLFEASGTASDIEFKFKVTEVTMRCLFVTHKWGDARPGTGESVTIPHLLDTFEEWGGGSNTAFWTDERYHEGQNLERELEALARRYKPDIVVYTPIPSPALSHLNISPEVMRSLPGLPLTVLFDHAQVATRPIVAPFAETSHLTVNIDGCIDPIGPRYLALWPARTRRPSVAKDIDVSFLGARQDYPDRVRALSLLQREAIPVRVSGGRAEDRQSFADYFSLMDRSLMTLNFSRTVDGDSQLKARVIEAISCGCCLVEDCNETTCRYLDPESEFISYGDVESLPELLRGLIQDKTRALAVGRQGRSAFESRLSAYHFWQKILHAL